MGFRVLLVAVNGKAPAVIHWELGVIPAERFEQVAEAPVLGMHRPNGSYMLYINDPDLIAPDDTLFARLSRGAHLLACYANETYMESLATCWEDGHKQWSVHHDSE